MDPALIGEVLTNKSSHFKKTKLSRVENVLVTGLLIHDGEKFLPIKENNRRDEINRDVCALLRGMIKEREKEMKMGNARNDDLLGLLMESNFRDSREQGNSKGFSMTIEDVIDECKLFYFAGQETTAALLTWTMVVLSMHPNWQVKAREEVLQVFGKNKPDFDSLNRLKIVSLFF
ncbi:hypothetical protein MRB53_015678 [Persea americana]|uniref:Uncharacterized protein n=1 Tax=Persea americana TaxID=3435 RepID=A0ACC2M104_PERAE|nr:hypothetical protein MRB53_015678 [Persea americana]